MTKNYVSVVTTLLLGTTISPFKGESINIKLVRTWRSLALILVGLFSFAFMQGQNITNYAFTTGTNGSLQDISVDNTSYLTGNNDDVAGTVRPLGFDFIFMGVRYTHFSANSNGQMELHTSSSATAIGTSVTTAANRAILAPFTGDNEVNNGMRFKITGTAPNRTFILEWNQFYINFTNLSNAGNMQVLLEETTGAVTYIYGEIYNASTSAQTRSISLASSNTATTVGSINIGATPTFTAGTALVVNTIAAGVAPVGITPIANIGSTADGSRRFFTFTPQSNVSGDVTNLTFSGVTQNGITINWDDNAINESGFLVIRATDAAFTQNVSTTAVASTTAAGTGTAYSSIQTGLSAGTNFFYKVIAIVEGGQSIGISGNQATLDGATYYWTGATGGLWNAFANWNTAADGSGSVPTVWANSDTYIIDGEGTNPGGTLAISVDRASFTVGQVRITSNTNLTLASSATATRTITISGGPDVDFLIENGSTLNLINATNAVAFAFSGAGNTGTIAGTYIAGGAAANTINTTAAGTFVTVTSTGNITSNLNSSTGCLTGNITNLVFENGSNWTHQNSTTVNYIPNATWQANATATLNGNTTGTTLTSASPVLGNLIINNTLSTATLSAFTTNSRTILGDLTVNSTGTGRFRAVTSGILTINGNLIVNGGIFDVASVSGTVVVKGNTTIASGTTLDANQGNLNNEGNMINNGTILSSETTTANSRINFFGTTGQQTFSGTGTFSGRVSSLGVFNPLGLNITSSILVQRVNLFAGLISGSSFITIGTGLALPAAVQIGQVANAFPGGSFDVSPVFNIGTGVYTLLYLGETTPRTTGLEVPPTRSINNLTLDNPNGLTIAGGTIEVLNGLTLTNGVVNATSTDHIIHGSATVAGTLTGGSSISYVNGPIVRTINDANAAANFVLYPVGKAGAYAPIWLAPTTTSPSRFVAETFDTNPGTADASIISLSTNRIWQAQLATGSFNDINVRLGDANLVATNIPVHASSANGIYSSPFGSVATFTAGTPNTVQSNNAVASASYNGFLSYADSNACNGTPAPGNTISSITNICLGESVTLSLQNTTNGSGVTYQWQFSLDGISYTDIAAANGITLTTTPSQSTFYRCNVTCASGSLTGTSNPVQVIFSNSVTATIPATRCGLGTVTLEATPSTGANINWYAAPTGGTPLASGNSFTTPSISTTTTYFASAETSTAGSVLIGQATTLTGATAQPSAFVNRWPSYRIQTLYTAAELSAAGLGAGNITSMSYFTTTLGDAATNANFTVKIGNSSQSSMTTTWVPTTSFETVYGPVTHTHTASGEQPINFTTPFNWDGVSNIVIEVMYNGADITNNAITFFTATTNNMVVHSNFSGSAAPSGTVTTTRLNLKLVGQVACQSARVPVVATVTSPPALTLSAATAAICEGEATTIVTLTSTPGDFDTYVWSPSTGVSGNQNTGWTFNPAASTSYTLTASQTAGSLCSTTTTFDITVNPLPTPVTIVPVSATVCTDTVQSLVASGGILGSIMDSQIGTATTLTGATSQPTAFCNRFEHYWIQMVYTAAELTAAGVQPGNITALRFRTGAQGSADNVTDFKVRLGNTTNSVLTGFTTTGLNQVFSVATYTTVVGVNTITFDTPFAWDGVSNIIVDMRQTGIDSVNNATTEFTATSGNTVVTAVTSSTIAGGSDGFAATAPFATTSVNRLNTIFVVDSSIPSAITWSPVTNLFTDDLATVPYVANSNASTVYFRSATPVATTYTATATSGANCTVTKTVDVTAVDCGIPYANLQFPGTATIYNCESQTFFAQVFKAGVTEAAGPGAGIQAWIGRNNANTDPSTWAESSWELATFNVQVNNNDEYQVTFGPSASGIYYVASRFVFVPGNFVYGGFTPTGGGIWDGTTNVSAVLTVENVPVPTVNAQEFCNAATVADLVATGAGLQWYSNPTGGTPLTATTLLASGNYYVSQTINGCESDRAAVIVTINNTAAPTASTQEFCNVATVADLVATGAGLQWYASPTGGTPLSGTTALASGNYYVSQNLNGCESARTTVAVIITTVTTPTGAANQVITGFNPSDATIDNLVVSGTGIVWYATAADALAGTNPLAAGTQLVNGQTYYAVSVVGSCRSAALAVTVTVTLGVQSFDISSLKFYPNPVSDVLSVRYTQNITKIEIFDLSGRKVLESKTNDTVVSINVNELAASVYVVKVFANSQMTEFKIVKQ